MPDGHLVDPDGRVTRRRLDSRKRHPEISFLLDEIRRHKEEGEQEESHVDKRRDIEPRLGIFPERIASVAHLG